MSCWVHIFSLCIVVMMITAGLGGAEGPVKLTYLYSAAKHGAVCLDGSPPAYHIVRGVGHGTDKWIVSLEGGALCPNTENCLSRVNSSKGSSKLMHPVNFTGFMSNNQSLNPYFYNWNQVLIRYCDGGLYTGNRYDAVHRLHYRGAKIFNFVMKNLLDKGMNNATKVLLHGCSAGGQAAILLCDKFRSFLPLRTNVKCAAEGGYFIHTKDIYGEYNFEKVFMEGCAKLHGSIEYLPKACTSAMKPKSLCLYPQYVIPHIKTPVFIINSAFDKVQIEFNFAPYFKNLTHSWEMCDNDLRTCSRDQLEKLKGFRLSFLRALPRGNGTFRAMFITSCDLHCRCGLEPDKNWSPEMRIEQKELMKGLGNWMVAETPIQKIDHSDVPRVCT